VVSAEPDIVASADRLVLPGVGAFAACMSLLHAKDGLIPAMTEAVKDNATEQQHIIFDPIPRVDGIEPSADPLLELRAAIYLLSGRRRRAAKLEAVPA